MYKMIYLAQVSSSNKNNCGFNSIYSMTLADMLVDPEAEFVLKLFGSMLAMGGRLSMKGEMSTPMHRSCHNNNDNKIVGVYIS